MKNPFKKHNRPLNMLFLMRIASIERHIDFAVDEVSFEKLLDASTRLEYEIQYSHCPAEVEIINEINEQVRKAKEDIKATLIFEYYNQ